MLLKALPLVFVLAGLALYTVLGGADFGAGFWQLLAGRGERASRIREHAHHSMGPVWEANHVWLIFVLTVFWTAYPTRVRLDRLDAGGRRCSSPRSGSSSAAPPTRCAPAPPARASRRVIDTIFSLSSILTPFALGAAIGGDRHRPRPGRQRRGRTCSPAG